MVRVIIYRLADAPQSVRRHLHASSITEANALVVVYPATMYRLGTRVAESLSGVFGKVVEYSNYKEEDMSYTAAIVSSS